MAHSKKVLITGIYGLIGNVVYGRLRESPDRYDVYGLTRRQQSSERLPGTEMLVVPEAKLHVADLSDFAAMQKAVRGMDVVVHMAADPRGDAPWESVLRNNIVGAYHIFEASRLAGVRRVVYASTLMVIFGHEVDEPYKSLFEARYEQVDPSGVPPILHTQPARPRDLYACSKVWGEALAHMYAQRFGMSCICLRIGWVTAEEPNRDPLARCMWSSKRDIAQLVELCINAPDSLRYDVFFGLSNNQFNLADIQHARDVLGYQPQDRIEDLL